MVQSDLGGPKGLGLGRLFRSSCSEASPAPRHPNKDEAHASTLVDAVRLFRSSYSEASPAPRHPKMHEPNAFTPVDAVRLFRSACSEAFPAPRHPKEDEPHAPAPGDGRNQSPLMRADPKEEVRRKKGERASARPGGPRRWSEPQRLHRLQPCSGSLSTSPSWHSSKPPLSKPPQHCSQPLARSLSISHEVPRTGPLRRDWSPDPFSRARLRREEGESGACQGSGEGWEGKALEDMSPSDLVECMQAGIQAGKQCGTQSVTSSSMPSGGSQGVDLAGAATRLRVLARDSQGIAKKVVEAGALGPLSELLQSGDEEIVEQAATAILNIALHDRLRPQVVHHAGIIPALVAALGCPCAAAQSSAAAALCCMPAEAKEEIWGAGVLGPLLHILREVGDPTAKKDAAHCLFSLSLAKEHRSAIAQAGAVPVLCAILEDEHYDLDTEIAGILAALSRDSTGRARMLEAGAVGALAEIMETGATECSKEYAVTALLQLAAKCRACLESIFQADISLPLDALTRSLSAETEVKARALQALLREWETAHCPQEA